MSSSSSSSSDEDPEPVAPGLGPPPPASQLSQAVELAQICSFCATFRKPLRLPAFSRTELQDALLGVSNGHSTHVELLAELHFKLVREHPTAKMEKMVQDWEKTLARKLQENWRREFTANPMGGGVAYRDLTVLERVKILDALCHWKLDTCAEIHKHIATLQKENDNDSIKKLRVGEIGTDDNGVSYWYFDDGAWIYAEDKPRWQREERYDAAKNIKPSYLVEFASAKRIRLSINFDPDRNSSAPPVRLPLKLLKAPEDVKAEKMATKEVPSETVKHESKIKDEAVAPEPIKAEGSAVKVEKQEFAALQSKTSTDETNMKEGHSTSTSRVDNGFLCAVGSPDEKRKFAEPAVDSPQTNGAVQMADAAIDIAHPDSSTKVVEDSSTALGKCDAQGTATSKENTSTEEVNEDISGEHPVVAIVGSKKRAIIDDDSSDSSSDVDATKAAANKEAGLEVSTPPPRKKRKASVEHTNSATSVVHANSEAGVNADETHKNDMTKSENTQANGDVVPPVSDAKPVVTEVKGTDTTSEPKERNEGSLRDSQNSKVATEKTVDGTDAKPVVTEVKGTDTTSEPKERNEGSLTDTLNCKVATEKTVDGTGPASTSPTDPAAAPESFEITCESCKKSYDMRYVDPPLVERPTDEWRCFECLVNDARGWPRRRKSTRREPFSPRADGRGNEGSSKKRSSSSKARSGSSTSTKAKKSSSKSSSSKKKSSRSSSSKRKSSSSKSSSSKKSSSSSKKHKKRKSSSSSHHHSSSSHHRRRHHNHYHHEEFAKLVGLFRERQEHRLGIEEARIKGDLQVGFDEAPQGWRVVSSTLDDLRALIQTLLGGSLEQDRLRGRLILILKDQEKLQEQLRKQQEMAWNILPRRQSSRIAIGRMRQSAEDSDAEEGYSDDDVESRRPGLRSSGSHSTMSDGFDDKQKLAHDRASRARRRHLVSDDEMDMDDEDDEVGGNGPTPGNWFDWSLLKGNTRRLSTVCMALVNRLLKEEAADLFSRPVDPALDGCPNYLSVIDQPMDLGTIRSRLESNYYQKWDVFKKDVELVWQNCRTFNAPDTMVVQFADVLSSLSRSMCVAAERKGVDHMKDIGNSDDASNPDGAQEDGNFSDASKAESRSSVNKAWTASSASESSESSNGDSSSGGDNGSDSRSRKRRPARSSRTKLPTHSRSTRSSHSSGPAKPRPSRSSARSRSSKKRPAPSSSSEDESSASEEMFSRVRKSRRQPRGSASKVSGKVDPPTDDDSSDDQSAGDRPAPPQNGAPSPSPPPPPPPQAVQKRSKPRLIISDSSSSDDSSDSNSSSSSSSDSDDSDSDARPVTSKRPEPPSPSSAEVPAPPPPSPPPPAAPPVDSKPRSSPKVSSIPKTAANHGRKAKAPSAAKTEAEGSGYAHSQPLLNTYLSPSSSSSSDSSSGGSDSSGGDSDDSD